MLATNLIWTSAQRQLPRGLSSYNWRWYHDGIAPGRQDLWATSFKTVYNPGARWWRAKPTPSSVRTTLRRLSEEQDRTSWLCYNSLLKWDYIREMPSYFVLGSKEKAGKGTLLISAASPVPPAFVILSTLAQVCCSCLDQLLGHCLI